MVKSSGTGTFAAFAYRNFQHFTWGQIANMAGTRVQEVASGWLMWELTHSAAWVGAIAVAEMIPRLLLWPVSGAVVDRVDRRRLAIVAQSLAAATAAGLAILSAFNAVGVATLLIFTALLGVNASFWQPVRFALVPRLVPHHALSSAVALTSVIANVGRVIGPIIAGPVILWGSVTMAFALNSLSFVCVVIAFCLIRLPPGNTSPKTRFSWWDLSLGLKTVFENEGVRMLIVFVAIFALCVRPAADLLPVFAEDILDAGPAGLATLISAMGVGSLFSGLVASRQQDQYSLVRALGLAGVTGAVMTAALVLTSNLWVAAVVIAIMGFGVTMKNIIGQILLQLTLPDEVRGRVFSIYGMLFGCLPGVGALIIGWLADRIGLSTPILVASAIGLGSSLLVIVMRHRLAALLTPPPPSIGQSST